jgi:hypothetical protein
VERGQLQRSQKGNPTPQNVGSAFSMDQIQLTTHRQNENTTTGRGHLGLTTGRKEHMATKRKKKITAIANETSKF